MITNKKKRESPKVFETKFSFINQLNNIAEDKMKDG
jgi:hypothetical protein